MIKYVKKHLSVKKATPSEGISLAWLAGIIDGEGSIGRYKMKRGGYIIGVSVINTDTGILEAVRKIYLHFGIIANVNNKSVSKSITSHKRTKPCYEIVVRRRDDIHKILFLIKQYLKGEKRKKAVELLNYLKKNPKVEIRRLCEYCGKETKRDGRGIRFCNQKCWHEYAKGKLNPNWRHGKNIQRVETKRETPQTRVKP